MASIRMGRLQQIYLTRLNWDAIGGLSGMLLTLQASHPNDNVQVHSAGDIAAYANCTTSFARSVKGDYRRLEAGAGVVDLSDGSLTLQAYMHPIPPGLGSSPETTHTAYLNDDVLVSYIGHVPEAKGRFDAVQAKALGLTPGPMYKQLIAGQSVRNDAGVEVRPEQVLLPVPKNPAFAVLDIPDLGCLQAAIGSNVGTAFAALERHGRVYHRSTLALAQSPAYAPLLASFGPLAEHVLCDLERDTRVLLYGASINQCLLNRMDSFAFPLFAHADVTVHPDGPTIVANGVTMLTSEPLRCASLLAPRTAERERKAEAKRQRKQETTQASQHSKKPKPWRTQETEAETDSTPTAAADIAPLAATVPIEPEDKGSCILKAAIARLRESGQRQWTPVDVAGWQQLLQQVPGLADRLPPVEQHATLHQATSPCVLFLGTGSAIPSKYRNVTAMMLTIPAVAAYPAVSVLLDCGEGTVGQLQRMLGRAEASVHLSQLQLVHISHIHADHLLGLPGVLRARQQARQARSLPTAPLMVVGPKPLWQWLIAAGFVPGRDFMLTMNHNFFPEGVTASDHSVGTNATGQKMVARIQERLASLGIVRFATVPVIHCRFATGCVVEHASGWKLVWSGDTRPCPEIATMAQGADVLIHEATFDVDLIDEAKAKNHSTTPEAIDIANQAGVKALVLTHFSQRYPRVPKLDSSKPDNPAVVHPGMPTMIAFDTMRYSFQDAERLSLFVPALQHLFESLYPEDIERLEARQDGSA